jgi:hypothetical protein
MGKGRSLQASWPVVAQRLITYKWTRGLWRLRHGLVSPALVDVNSLSQLCQPAT